MVGDAARGRQLMAGNILLAGELVEAPGLLPWDIAMPSSAFEGALHGFRWLDDLAAIGTADARSTAQAWTWDWIDRFGKGKGAGWTPDRTGRRLIRWISHAVLLLRGRPQADSAAFFAVLGRQTLFLSRRWHAAAPGLPRFEAVTGLIYAGLSLEGMERYIAPALDALDNECATQIDDQGGIATRNPEDLLEVFALLSWTAQVLTEAGHTPSQAHKNALERIAPTLRALRHADGGLARFNGGGAGEEGRLDQALAASHVRPGLLPEGLAMGYARLTAGRTSLIVDAAAPPTGPASANAHAGTLAFELTSGRRPVIVNCGSGAAFGETWRRAGRATPSHSTLAIEGVSSSQLALPDETGAVPKGSDYLETVPKHVTAQSKRTSRGWQLLVGHDGYGPSHGLTHVRNLLLSLDGRTLSGEDLLGALDDTQKRKFDSEQPRHDMQGTPFILRFHLHPEVDAIHDMNGTAISIALRSGEVWIFRHNGKAALTLEPSVYLEPGRLKPRACKQIVLRARVTDYAMRIVWTLAKAQDTPQAVRDVED